MEEVKYNKFGSISPATVPMRNTRRPQKGNIQNYLYKALKDPKGLPRAFEGLLKFD